MDFIKVNQGAEGTLDDLPKGCSRGSATHYQSSGHTVAHRLTEHHFLFSEPSMCVCVCMCACYCPLMLPYL